jgi:hypothetical protein
MYRSSEKRTSDAGSTSAQQRLLLYNNSNDKSSLFLFLDFGARRPDKLLPVFWYIFTVPSYAGAFNVTACYRSVHFPRTNSVMHPPKCWKAEISSRTSIFWPTPSYSISLYGNRFTSVLVLRFYVCKNFFNSALIQRANSKSKFKIYNSESIFIIFDVRYPIFGVH